MEDPTSWVESAEGWDADRHYAERSALGFSKADWINFDTYIAWVIAEAVKKMKTYGHTMFSYPDEPMDKWEELTQADYDKMIKGFGQWAEYGHGVYDDAPETLDEDLDVALDIFKKRFRSLWD